MKTLLPPLLAALIVATASVPALANPFRPRFCGECTDGAYRIWVEYLGQPTSPSTRSGKYWYDDAPGRGYRRGSSPTAKSIICIDGTPSNSHGHVGVVWSANHWYDDWSLLWVIEYNVDPRTSGRCNAPFQGHWYAYHPRYRTYTWRWTGRAWTAPLPAKGYIYRR